MTKSTQPHWKWMKQSASLVVLIAIMPLFWRSNRVHWIAWGLGVAGGSLLLIASFIEERRSRK